MELVCFVVDSRSVSAALLGDDVNNHWLRQFLGLLEGSLQVLQVVPVDGTQVFDVEVGIQLFVIGKPGHKPANTTANTAERCSTKRPKETKELFGAALECAV